MMQLFITSTGTGIGKTFITATLCHQLKERGINITALKPVISGFDASDLSNDSATILEASRQTPSPEAQAAISPWHFTAPLSPNMAAAREGKTIDMLELAGFCRIKAAQNPGITLVEGVGGIMAPLTDELTVLDWMQTLQWPILLVCGSYLGSLSHTLSAIEVLQAKGLTIRAIIVSESRESSVSLSETSATLEKFLKNAIPVVQIPQITTTYAWKQVPEITWLCQTPKT